MKKRGVKKLINWKRLAHKEKILIVVLAIVIVSLAFYIGYDIYNSLKTKEETSYLNSAVISLSTEKSKLLSDIEELNNSVEFLEERNEALDLKNDDLTTELADLQKEIDALEEDISALEDDLDDCEASCP